LRRLCVWLSVVVIQQFSSLLGWLDGLRPSLVCLLSLLAMVLVFVGGNGFAIGHAMKLTVLQ
ncbi:hypothetical protein, partial [Mycobacterium sp. shizuoka-1]|uniref:hypothetical protein n=1 Tax=Mycobacterium sp. shizuoka-1 TaxID=2039281 RepID=UPI001E3EA15E